MRVTKKTAILRCFSQYTNLVLQEGIAVGRTFAALKNYQVDGNKEMIAIGMMNIVGSSTSCYVTTGFHFCSFKPLHIRIRNTCI